MSLLVRDADDRTERERFELARDGDERNLARGSASPAAHQHIALVGFMGAGKTAVGAHLARELGRSFVDSDAMIVARHGSIAALFARYGEAGFRRREYEAVRELLAAPPSVLALGGGALTHEPTRSLLAERAFCVYLEIPLGTLVARLRRSPTVRPLLGPAPNRERVQTLFAQREPRYRNAQLIVPAPRRGTQAEYARTIARELALRFSVDETAASLSP